jgi:hypothetical protein
MGDGGPVFYSPSLHFYFYQVYRGHSIVCTCVFCVYRGRGTSVGNVCGFFSQERSCRLHVYVCVWRQIKEYGPA